MTAANEKKPLVTVVVPCHNRANMVCTALDSVWNQTYRPLELIVADDGSEDNSMEVIENWRTKHPDGGGFSSVAKTFPNGGPCAARNRGANLAHGEYIQFLDDDDWLYPEAMAEKTAYASAHPELDLIVHQLDYVRAGKIINHTRITLPQKGENLIRWLLEHECLICPALMFKTDTLKKIGGWKEELRFAEDLEITIRLAALGGRIGLVDKRLSVYYLHDRVRLCTTLRSRLPDDYVAKLFVSLHELCRKENKLGDEVNEAFAEELLRSAVGAVREGRFAAAAADLEARTGISGRTDYMLFDCKSPMVWVLWRMQHCLWRMKYAIKALFR